MDGLGEGVIVGGLGVNVGVAGGATSRSNFCSGRMTEALFKSIPGHQVRKWNIVQASDP